MILYVFFIFNHESVIATYCVLQMSYKVQWVYFQTFKLYIGPIWSDKNTEKFSFSRMYIVNNVVYGVLYIV